MGKDHWKGQRLNTVHGKPMPRGYYGESEEDVDLCEFGIVYGECVFCNQPRTVEFDKHYNFCPNCKAIYTTMLIQKAGCKHVVDGTPIAIQEPWNEEDRKGAEFIRVLRLSTVNPDEPDQYFCSVCSKKCVVDGW